MTPTFCVVCRYLLMSDNHKCPLCGWPINNTPISFSVEQVREIIENVHSWNYQQNKRYVKLSNSVIKELKQKISELENKVL